MEFREVLQQTRKIKGWSQEDLAERVQVSRQAVSKWETGDAMPDLPKLLALAEALDISLDALCGRETPSADSFSSAAEPSTAPKPDNRSRLVWMLLCGLLALCLLATGLWAWSRRNYVPSEHAEAQSILPDSFTVTGVSFAATDGYGVAYQFSPSITGEGLIYQITFTDTFGESRTFDVIPDSGICSGIAELGSGYLSYTVTVSISDGINARHLAVAKDLDFDKNRVGWLPLVEDH